MLLGDFSSTSMALTEGCVACSERAIKKEGIIVGLFVCVFVFACTKVSFDLRRRRVHPC